MNTTSESNAPAPPPSPGVAPPPSTRFEPAELEAVLRRYDLGRIDSLREFSRGSPAAPKVLIAGPEGKFLLKRRAPGEDHPHLVAFCHALHLHLLDRAYPAPAIIGTRDDNNSMLQLDGRVYEVTEFVEGDPFDRSPAAAAAAGRALARFHAGVTSFHNPWHSPPDFAHGDERAEILIDRCLDRLMPPPSVAALGDGGRAGVGGGIASTLDHLRTLWRRAVSELDHAGIAAWPRQLLHADWHPGNVVFRGSTIRAVLDFDSCKRGPRIIDAAAGALHFSIMGGDGAAGPVDPARWPAEPDRPRARAFLAGYQEVQPALSQAERDVLAPAMAAAMILESLPPIAASGAFAGIPGPAFLDMVRRKSAWLLEHAAEVSGFAVSMP